MAKDPAFLFYPGDYLRDTQCLSESVQVAYDRIMCEHMRNICITQQQLNFFTKKLSQAEKDELLMVLTKIEGGYQIVWVAESINKRKDYSDSRRKNRGGGNNKDMSDISKTYVQHMDNENESVNKDKDKSETTVLAKEKLIHPIQILVAEHLKNVSRLKEQLTVEQCQKLYNKFTSEQIKEVLVAMENKKDLNKKYVSVYLTVLSWIKIRNNNTNGKPAHQLDDLEREADRILRGEA